VSLSPAVSADVRATIAEMARRIVAAFQPDKIILFGSYARGDAGPDSDVDLLVVMPVETSKRERAIQILNILNGMRLAKEVVVVTPEEFEKRRDVVGTVEYAAVREGLVLYERAT
jgi:predicted nucleotidyltransferase